MANESLKALVTALHAVIDERIEAAGGAAKPAAGKPAAGKAAGKPAAAEDSGPDMDSLKEKLTQVLNDKGADIAKGILTKFKVKKLVELNAKQFVKFNEALDAALAEGEDDTSGDADDLFGED